MVLERLRGLLRDERGVALPLAMMVLVLLTGLTAAFVAMAGMEPFIASNHQASSQALGIAEAGLERGIWALDVPSSPQSFNIVGMKAGDPLPAPVPAPYDGSQLVALGTGSGYSLAICAPDAAACPPASPDPRDRNITAVGYVMRGGVALPAVPAGVTPTDRTAQKTVTATLTYIGPPSPPGALTSGGSVDMGGNSHVDGNNMAPGVPNNCPKKGGITIKDKTTLAGNPPTVVDNTITMGGTTTSQGTPSQQEMEENAFNNEYLFTDSQLAALKALAMKEGTYIKPSSNVEFKLDVVDGLIFVDTVGGAPLGNPPDASLLANVRVNGASNSGWLVVMGSLKIDGNVTYNGLIYALNDITYRGTGSGMVQGAVMSANIVDQKSTIVDTQTLGNAEIYFDCEKVKNGGGKFKPPEGYLVKGGTWRETSN